MISLQQSHLPESAEILDILNKIEFEGLFYSHDKLAQLQVSDSPLPLPVWLLTVTAREVCPGKSALLRCGRRTRQASSQPRP